ncbi:MAG: 4Fe-4S dicluster domain-containing protein [Deltaproteobacteria bacterium]|nr:4Fe-4S dicluster domain-containing protein [Deltaproteobacteria bacterium]MCL5276991.1 4Fe-4S dicluster domain-containing protein [Deltaproteobacteria bacterium]
MDSDKRRFLRFMGISTGLVIGSGFLGGLSSALRLGTKLGGSALAAQGAVSGSLISSPSALKAGRWAMAIDLRKFKTNDDYRRCIDACDEIHNIPDIPTGQEIKWVWEEPYENAFPEQQNHYLEKGLKDKPILLMCNQCEYPPCVRVCPTGATFKRRDGIVMMDYHRCIGCRYCMAACPYGSRSFNFQDPRPFIKHICPDYPTRTKGVVEKCDFCAERLDKGLLPACVEASNGAMVFGDLDDPNSDIRKLLSKSFSIRRKPELGTQPSIFYIL